MNPSAERTACLARAADPCAANPQLLFLVGMWRSGTSLLHTLVNQHPQISLMYEAEPLDLWPGRGSFLWGRDWPERLEYYNQTLSRHQLDADLVRGARPGRDAALSLYREYGRKRHATVYGEKAPAYYRRLPLLARLFPEARFIVVWRDPLVCCQSALRAARQNRFFASPGMAERILFGAAQLAEGIEWLHARNRPVHEVVFDDLVAAPEAELRRICQFLRLQYAPEMARLNEASLSSLPTGEHHAGVRSGVIARPKHTDDPLTPEFTRKARRYGALWRRRFANLGFARALSADVETTTPGGAERWQDVAAACQATGSNHVRQAILRRLPLSLWARLRARPRQTPDGNPLLSQGPVAPGET